jgi:Protein of unknown function (DUF2934)
MEQTMESPQNPQSSSVSGEPVTKPHKPSATAVNATPGKAKAPRVRKAATTARRPATRSKALAKVERPASDALAGMIAMAAYYRAAERNFAPGHELEDWLAAERRILALYQ